MAGIDAQVGLADEGTYGTYTAPDHFYEFVPPESLRRSEERIESRARRPGEFALSSGRWEQGRRGVEGELEFELLDQGSAFLWKHALGQLSSTQPDDANDPTVYEHTAEVGSLNGKSLTAQIGRPQLDGTVVPFNYVGLKVMEWELSVEVDGTLGFKLTLDGADELDAVEGGPLVTPDFTSSDPARLLHFAGGTVTLDGSDIDLKSFTLAGTNALKADRYFLRGDGSRVKKEQLRNGRNNYTGSLVADFEGRTLYDKFVDGEHGVLSATFLGRTLPGTTAFRAGVKVDLGTIRFDGDTPQAGDDDVLEQSVPFTVLYDRTAAVSPVIVTVTDELATP